MDRPAPDRRSLPRRSRPDPGPHPDGAFRRVDGPAAGVRAVRGWPRYRKQGVTMAGSTEHGQKIAFLGTGKIGEALLSGLLRAARTRRTSW